MSINPTKYIKLSTQPWTGNGIAQPIKSITLQDIPTNPSTGSVELTELNNELLVNGQALTPGPSPVLSLTSAPGSVVEISPPTGVGGILIGTDLGSGVTSITAVAPLIVTPLAPNQTNATLSIDTTTYLKSITTPSFDLSLSSSVGDVVLGSFGSIGQAVISQQFPVSGVNIQDAYVNTSTLPNGVYLLTQEFTLAFNQLFEIVCYFKVSNGTVSCYASTVVETTGSGGRSSTVQSLAPTQSNRPNWMLCTAFRLYQSNDIMTISIYRVS
jgi:hypothetical protein